MDAIVDPWTIERARRPGAKLLRFIDLERDEQRFIVLGPSQGDDQADVVAQYDLDGCTVIYPAGAGRTPAETAELVRLYDELYREHLAAVPA